ncbi:HupE/UreJ family protein [Aurantimonas sp. VKM B-3413]|uniref:HupE/UreJ family protein n=1 Tax=Aurantimonas sp. VKM B-3413 TaxID=2779401 RepID=UPI001E464A18|nr:HupE/UreJ family protein [Aurantimonas sp. VKM B-3413]MCB8839136.1 HupE/UreJ family protein [Aurantimonas sp. VKM B-3413]
MLKRLAITAATLAAATAPAFAHINPLEHGSFLAGVSHPLTGLDHLLVMVAVGVWAAMIGGRALWVVPLAFVGTMSAGFVLALSGVHLPFVEPAILASVVALGLLVAAAVKLPVPAAAGIVGAFALFHGHAHGTEFAGSLAATGAEEFGLGFALSTAALHGTGLALGLFLSRISQPAVLRVLGAASAAAGLYLMAG